MIYCDYIAKKISDSLIEDLSRKNTRLHDVMDTKLDLDPDAGFLVSTKKTIKVMDEFGNTYKVTIEEDNE